MGYKPTSSKLEHLLEEGLRHLSAGMPAEAERYLRRATELAPASPAAHTNLALVLEQSGKPDEAEMHYRLSLAAEPDLPQTHLNLGALLHSRKRLDEAEAAYRTALSLDPGNPTIWSNLGNLLACRKQEAAAEDCLRKALAIDPLHRSARFNLSYVLLRQGRFTEGWQCFDARNWYARFEQSLNCRRWQGEHLAGRTLLIVPEAGHGDMIQFCRYIKLVKECGAAHVSLLCHPGLKRLFTGLDGLDAVCCGAGDWPAIEPDFWTPLLSLPGRFNTDITTIPAALPYLKPADRDLVRMASIINAHTPAGNLKVGLAWRGNPRFENDAERSLPNLETLAPLGQLNGVRLFSLQKDSPEAATPPAGLDLVDLAPLLNDFADTAAAIANLDLVISVDTAVAHLAGALAKPFWLMLSDYKPDWRWLVDRDDSPWYPDVARIFRQQPAGDWQALVSIIVEALSVYRNK